jgi:hypothetical protein
MKCAGCRELLVSCLEGVLDQRAAALVAEHLESCPDCRKELEAVAALRDRLLQDGRRAKTAGFTAKVMSNIPLDKDFTKVKEKNMFQRHPLRISLAAAAAIVAVVIGLAIIQPRRVYALDATIEANKHIASIHFVQNSSSALSMDASGKLSYRQGVFIEGWLEYDEKGSIQRLRMEYPITEDGPKTVVWQNGKATVWFKDKKAMGTTAESNRERLGGYSQEEYDPKLLTERLKEAEIKGTVKITTQELPNAFLEPHVLIAEWSKPANRREVYLVDRITNLVLRVDSFVGKGNEMLFTGRKEFLDYNQPIPDSVFTLNPPPDVIRIDRTSQNIGMEKGSLSDNEVAKKAAREFFEALMAKNYAKAGQLFGGIPESKMAEYGAKMHIIKIVSIGEPYPMKYPGVGGVQVNCDVEINRFDDDGLVVIRVPGHADRWEIEPVGGVPWSPTADTGLPQGNLSDSEIAAKVAHEFLDAMVAKDFAKAGQLWGGAPAKFLSERMEKMETKVSSVGQPVKREASQVGGFKVPCTVEMSGVETFILAIRAEYNQPERWVIHGGF